MGSHGDPMGLRERFPWGGPWGLRKSHEAEGGVPMNTHEGCVLWGLREGSNGGVPGPITMWIYPPWKSREGPVSLLRPPRHRGPLRTIAYVYSD